RDAAPVQRLRRRDAGGPGADDACLHNPRRYPCAPMDEPEVKAAGGVVLLDGRIALVHRPRYDDWSLPKGKLDPGESFEDAALREVWEETGVRGRIRQELQPVEYVDRKGRDKLVRWYRMDVDGEPDEFVPNDEIDELRWRTPAEARALVDYDHDRALLGTIV